jgi:hypothetical protein
MEKWPNFFIVGAPKAGTTSLYEYLKNINEIYFPKIKEPHYFSRIVVPENHYIPPIRDTKEYLKLYENVNSKILGDASVYYLSDLETPTLIHNVSPNAHIIISLRDPVERVYSHHLMQTTNFWLKTSFHDQLEKEMKNPISFGTPSIRLESGLYYEDVKRYLDIFGPKQVKILIFEEWIKNIEKTIQEILIFLDLTVSQIDLNDFPYNEYKSLGKFSKQIIKSKRISKIARATLTKSQRDYLRNKLYRKGEKPIMEDNDRKILIDFYKNDVKKLECLLGRKLPWKNFTSS